jgi:hypothetical protein
MNPTYAMKPLWKATWLIRIHPFQVVPGSPMRYYWRVVGFNQLQKTYIHPKDYEIFLRQNRDSPTPQHCIGMFKRFAALNGITHYRIINNKEK